MLSLSWVPLPQRCKWRCQQSTRPGNFFFFNMHLMHSFLFPLFCIWSHNISQCNILYFVFLCITIIIKNKMISNVIASSNHCFTGSGRHQQLLCKDLRWESQVLSNVYIQQQSRSFACVHSRPSGGKCAKQSLIPDLNQCLSPVSECDASQVRAQLMILSWWY